jgi:hypothetical protein
MTVSRPISVLSPARHDALFGESCTGSHELQAAKAAFLKEAFGLSLSARSTSRCGRSPQGPMVGPEQRKEAI